MRGRYERRTQSKYNVIRELKVNDNISGLIDVVRKMSKQVNQRFYRLEKRGVAGSSIAYQYAQNETGKDKPRYTTSKRELEKMGRKNLFRLADEINKKLISRDSTIVGLQKIEENRLDAAASKLKRLGIDLSADELRDFLNAGGSEFLNNKFLDSAQVLEDFVEFTKNGNITSKEFLREFKRYRNKFITLEQESSEGVETDFDYGKIKRNLRNLRRRKEK